MTITIRSLLVPAAALSLAGCMTDAADDELGTEAAALSGGNTVPICHHDGQGRVRLIHVNAHAVPAHEAHHGDHGLGTYYADADGDGFGAGDAIEACTQPPGTSTDAGDCNDGDAAINPAAAEVCGDNTDNDCDGAFADAQAVFMFAGSNGQRFDGPPGCTAHRDVTVQVCRETPDQPVLLSSTEDGAGLAYYDEIGRVVVTAPSGAVAGANYRWFEPTCLDAGYPDVFVGNAPVPLDITGLFGSEYGTFSVNVRVSNAHQPYEWFTTWVVPVD